MQIVYFLLELENDLGEDKTSSVYIADFYCKITCYCFLILLTNGVYNNHKIILTSCYKCFLVTARRTITHVEAELTEQL